MPLLDATERLDMTHVQGTTWRFRYEVAQQATPVSAPVPLSLAGRTYRCLWLAEKGSDDVVATATIEDGEAEDGVIVAVVSDEADQPVGDHWWFLEETNGTDVSVPFAGVVTVEDST